MKKIKKSYKTPQIQSITLDLEHGILNGSNGSMGVVKSERHDASDSYSDQMDGFDSTNYWADK